MAYKGEWHESEFVFTRTDGAPTVSTLYPNASTGSSAAPNCCASDHDLATYPCDPSPPCQRSTSRRLNASQPQRRCLYAAAVRTRASAATGGSCRDTRSEGAGESGTCRAEGLRCRRTGMSPCGVEAPTSVAKPSPKAHHRFKYPDSTKPRQDHFDAAEMWPHRRA